MKYGKAIPQLCTSLVFFIAFFMMVSRKPDPVLDNLVLFIISGLSFCGIVLTIAGMKTVSDRWYLGVPHAAAIGIVFVIFSCRFFLSEHNVDYLVLSLAFLSMTSTGFFMAFPESHRKFTRYFAVFSGMISTYAFFVISQVVCGLLHPLQTSWNVVDLYSGLFMIIFLPLLGLCHICAAIIGCNSGEENNLQDS